MWAKSQALMNKEAARNIDCILDLVRPSIFTDCDTISVYSGVIVLLTVGYLLHLSIYAIAVLLVPLFSQPQLIIVPPWTALAFRIHGSVHLHKFPHVSIHKARATARNWR